MLIFTYSAVREDGTSVAAEFTIATVDEVRQAWETRGYLVLAVQKKQAAFRSGGTNPKDFLLFYQEFMTLIKAGLPFLQALEILHKRMEKPGYRSALAGIIEAVKGGTALSDAMAAHPTFFLPLFTATVRAGEQSGALVDVLKRYIAYQKRTIALKRKVRSALIYPVFLVLMLVAVLAVYFLYIIPNFTQMHSDQAKLPMLTTALVSLTTFIVSNAPLLGTGLVAAAVGLSFWKRTASGW